MNFWPEQTGIGKYSGEMAQWLAAQGHSVRVVCSVPYYPEWKIHPGYCSWRYRNDIWQNVQITRCPVWIPRRPRAISRILYLMIFALTSWPVALMRIFWRPDVVFVVEPPLSCVPAALMVARLSKAKAWLHVQDFEVDVALDLGLVRIPGLKGVITGIEKWLTKRFDIRSTISQKMLEKLNSKTGESARNILFPNWVDVDQIFPLDRESSFRSRLGLSAEASVALYSGNMGAKQGLEIVIEAARLLKDRRDLVFVLCGTGAAHEQLQLLGENLENIRWLPVQPLEELNDLLNLADIHLLPQRADAADLVMPSKLTGMLASGRAVLANANPGTQVYQVVSEVGLVVPPGDATAFATALKEMLSAPDKCRAWGVRGRQIAVEKLGRDAILSQFQSELVAPLRSGQ